MFQRYFTEAEQAALFKMVRSDNDILSRRDACWMEILLLTGMRICEFSHITIEDAAIAIQGGYLFVPAERRKGRTVVKADSIGRQRTVDTRKDLSIYVTASLREAMRTALRIRDEMSEGQQELLPADSALFVSRLGQRMSVRQYQIRFKRWVIAAGLPEQASPHWMRHTRAKNIMRHSKSSDPRSTVKSVLGHASIASTGIYTEPDKEQVAADLEEVERATTQRPRMTMARLRKLYQEGLAA